MQRYTATTIQVRRARAPRSYRENQSLSAGMRLRPERGSVAQAKRDAELLLNDVLPFAQTMLAKYGEFHPYGAYMKADGSIVHVGATDSNTERPRPIDLLDTLKAEYRTRANAGDIRAAALVSNVRVLPPNHTAKTDAIQVTVEHADSYCADVFLPYHLGRDGTVVFGELFAQQGQPSVFTAAL